MFQLLRHASSVAVGVLLSVVLCAPAFGQSRLQDQLDALPDGGKLILPSGTFQETLRVEGKRIRIIGQGATGDSRTELVGPDSNKPVIVFTNGGGGSVRNVAVSGGSSGIAGGFGPEALPSSLKLRRLAIHQGVTGIAGGFSRLDGVGLDIRDTLEHGILVTELSEGMRIKKAVVENGGGAGIFLNLEQPLMCLTDVRVANSTIALNSHGGIVVVGDVCPVTIENSKISLNTGGGIELVDTGSALMQISNSTIEKTFAFSDGSYGDGIDAVLADNVGISDCEIELNERAGIGSFGSRMLLLDNQILCHAFDLNGEVLDGQDWSFDGSAGNVCGCETAAPCVAKSSTLAPPTPPTLP